MPSIQFGVIARLKYGQQTAHEGVCVAVPSHVHTHHVGGLGRLPHRPHVKTGACAVEVGERQCHQRPRCVDQRVLMEKNRPDDGQVGQVEHVERYELVLRRLATQLGHVAHI